VVTSSGVLLERPSQPTNGVLAARPAVPAQPMIPPPRTKPLPATETAPIKSAPANVETQAQTRAALEQKAAKPRVMSGPKQINANFPGTELGLKPIAVPSLGISGTKEAQLQALLAKYKADQITPQRYHTQRAQILAEP
jgi:hypothetical protein